MPDLAQINNNVQTEFPTKDVLYEILNRFETHRDVMFEWGEDYNLRELTGGLSGSVVLELQDRWRRLILKISRTAEADEEIAATNWFAQVIGASSVPSGGAICAYQTTDGYWTGFTLYHAASFADEPIAEPLTELVRGWDRCALVAEQVERVLRLLNEKFYQTHWQNSAAPDAKWLEGKPFPLAFVQAAKLALEGAPGLRIAFLDRASEFDRNPEAKPFSFQRHPITRWKPSGDRLHLVCRHKDDKTADAIDLEFDAPIPVEELNSLVAHGDKPLLVSGVVASSRSRHYRAIFDGHKYPDVASLLPKETAKQLSCRGRIHGDLHLGNILLIKDARGEIVNRALIDAASANAEGPLWWDYVKLEISLRRSLAADARAELGTLNALSALLDLASMTSECVNLAEDRLVAHWDAVFPQLLGAPRPLLRLRSKALELFRFKFHEPEIREYRHRQWLRDYQTCLCYCALSFLKYRDDPAVAAAHCDLAVRAYSGLAAESWYDFEALGPALATPVALEVVGRFLGEADSSPASRRAVGAALGSLHRLGESVTSNLLALDEPPLPIYRPPALTGLSMEQLDQVHSARVKLRAQESCLKDYRSETLIKLHSLEQTFAVLRGTYVIPLKAYIRETKAATLDVLSLVRGLPAYVVLGQPGSGKSTFAEYRRLTNARQGKRVPVAVVVTFSGWSNEARGRSGTPATTIFLDLVARQLGEETPLVQSLCEAGAFLFIIDGLNELEPQHRSPYVAAVKELHSLYPGNQFQVTSRTLHYRNEFDPWPTIVLEDLSEHEAKTYIRQTMTQLMRDNEELRRLRDEHHRDAEHLIDRLFSEQTPRSVRDLARTPMFLKLVVKFFADTGELPRSRGSLLAAATDDYYRHYAAKRSTPLSKAHLDLALKHLAYDSLDTETPSPAEEAAQERALVSVTKAHAAEILIPILATLGRGADAVWAELLETGLLHGVPGGDVATFDHQAFIEFYASLRLAEVLRADPAEFLRRAEQQVWQETLQTLVSYQTPDTMPAVQEFLRVTPDLHAELVTICLSSAEHIEADVLAVVVDRLAEMLNNPGEPLPRRSAVTEALSSIAGLTRDSSAWRVLLDHLARADPVPDVVGILVREQRQLLATQRQTLFSHVGDLLSGGGDAVEQRCIDVLINDDSTLAGAVLTDAIGPTSTLAPRARQALVRGAAYAHRLPNHVLHRLETDADPRVRITAVAALAGIGQPVSDSVAATIYSAAVRDAALFPDLRGELAQLPSDFFAGLAPLWCELALRHLKQNGSGDERDSEALILSVCASAPESIRLSQLSMNTAARLSLSFWHSVLDLPSAPEERVELARMAVRTLPKRSPIPDKELVESLLSSILRSQDARMGAVVAELVGGGAPEPLWRQFQESFAASPLASGGRLTAAEARDAIHRLGSHDLDIAGQAWLDLCRGMRDKELADLAESVNFRDSSALLRLSLLGYHSIARRLPDEVLSRLHENLRVQAGRWATPLGARVLRYAHDLLEQNRYFDQNRGARQALFRAALRQLPDDSPWFINFVLEKICKTGNDAIEDVINGGSGREIIQLCRFLAGVTVDQRLANRLFTKHLKALLATPDKITINDWSAILNTLANSPVTRAEDALVRVAETIDVWWPKSEAGRMGEPMSALLAGIFHQIMATLHRFNPDSAEVPRLVFKHFHRWDPEARRLSLRQLATVGWPQKRESCDQWITFIVKNLDALAGPDLFGETLALVDTLRNASEIALTLGRPLRHVTNDTRQPRTTQAAVEELVMRLEDNNRVHIPYRDGVAQRLQNRFRHLRSGGGTWT